MGLVHLFAQEAQVSLNQELTPYHVDEAKATQSWIEEQAAHFPGLVVLTGDALLVSSPDAFADSLCGTGVRKFIAQPFHFQRGKFLAGTRDKAFDLMAQKLGCDRKSFRTEYLEHYRMGFDVLKDTLPELGEGKDGFRPPFEEDIQKETFA